MRNVIASCIIHSEQGHGRQAPVLTVKQQKDIDSAMKQLNKTMTNKSSVQRIPSGIFLSVLPF